MNDFHPQSPNFAPFASLREILEFRLRLCRAGSFVVNRNQRDGHKEVMCALELPPITVDLV